MNHLSQRKSDESTCNALRDYPLFSLGFVCVSTGDPSLFLGTHDFWREAEKEMGWDSQGPQSLPWEGMVCGVNAHTHLSSLCATSSWEEFAEMCLHTFLAVNLEKITL